MWRMEERFAERLVPDDLWEIAEPLIPRFGARPQGGGTAGVDDRAVFTAIVFVLTSGCAWRHLPPTFGVSPATAHRRFTAWTKAGCGRGCTVKCWTVSAAAASWIGPQ